MCGLIPKLAPVKLLGFSVLKVVAPEVGGAAPVV